MIKTREPPVSRLGQTVSVTQHGGKAEVKCQLPVLTSGYTRAQAELKVQLE